MTEQEPVRTTRDCPECDRDDTAETGLATLLKYNSDEDRTYYCCVECGKEIAFTIGDHR